MTNTSMTGLKAGFSNPVLSSQAVFRQVLTAMSRPGTVQRIQSLPPAEPPLLPATAAVCLTLVDFETPLWLDAPLAASNAAGYLRFHCGCPLAAEPVAASFALISDPAAMPALCAFNPGRQDYPDRSATLIIQVSALAEGEGVRLSGPGIQESARLRVDGLPDRFWVEQEANRSLFPRGVDLVFTTSDAVAAMPRTTQVES